ncbi:MAG: hypothetical protein WA833_02695 [Nitrosotalea sp.]
MREERVTLSKIDANRLVTSAKHHLQELGLEIIHEDKFEGYHSIKAHKGGKIALVTGSIRDVELLLTGKDKDYDLTLRTGAWGRDIAIPTIFGGIWGAASTASVTAGTIAAGAVVVSGAVVTAGVPLVAGASVAVVEAYRAGKFEMNFWSWLNKEIINLGKEAMMTRPQICCITTW